LNSVKTLQYKKWVGPPPAAHFSPGHVDGLKADGNLRDMKTNPAHEAEDKLFKRSSKKSRDLLKKSRELKRDAARKAWWKENKS
jgi:hypothetical protein